MTEFQRDFQYGLRFMPHVKRILGEHLISEAPMTEDMNRNTDLMVLTLGAVRIACRVRRRQFYDRYPDDVTVRASRPSGAQTEFHKMLSGWGDYFLYGFADDDDECLHAWTLIDLKQFRLWVLTHAVTLAGQLPGYEVSNRDGTVFRVFAVSDLPCGVIVVSRRPPLFRLAPTECLAPPRSPRPTAPPTGSRKP